MNKKRKIQFIIYKNYEKGKIKINMMESNEQPYDDCNVKLLF